MPAHSARLRWGSVVAMLACLALIAVPLLVALGERKSLAGLGLFSGLTCLVLVVGLLWLHRVGLVPTTPAHDFHAAPLLFLVVLAVVWGFVIVDSPHASYFLFAMFALALWLLPPVSGLVVAVLLTVYTVGGQVVHHGLSVGALVGPVVALVVVVVMIWAYRTVLAESAEKSRLVDQLRRAQEQLAASEREAERARVGRDLHDTVAQSLSSIQLLLHAAEEAPDEQARHEHLLRARAAAAESLAETRSVIASLTPPDLAGRDLAMALGRVAARVAERGLPVEVDVEGEARPVPMPVEASLLRITQEALGNAVAHAGAARASIRLVFERDALSLEIDDDGVGFDVDRALATRSTSHGFGLGGMRARAAELGGYASIVSSPGDGTLVQVMVPLPEAEEER